jgi:nicotinamidase-related amidase
MLTRQPTVPEGTAMPAARRALIVVDVQEEYFSGPLAIGFPPVDESLARIIDATEAAGRAGIPVVVVQHEKPEGAALFAVGSPGWALHPRLAARIDTSWKRVTKGYASCFDGTDLAAWLSRNDIDTVTLVGYMTNNCILATAAAAAPLGLQAEVLSDATGAIDVANEAGSSSPTSPPWPRLLTGSRPSRRDRRSHGATSWPRQPRAGPFGAAS